MQDSKSIGRHLKDLKGTKDANEIFGVVCESCYTGESLQIDVDVKEFDGWLNHCLLASNVFCSFI
jgi:hypothetical protein